jgi:hypothetical protein
MPAKRVIIQSWPKKMRAKTARMRMVAVRMRFIGLRQDIRTAGR